LAALTCSLPWQTGSGNGSASTLRAADGLATSYDRTIHIILVFENSGVVAEGEGAKTGKGSCPLQIFAVGKFSENLLLGKFSSNIAKLWAKNLRFLRNVGIQEI